MSFTYATLKTAIQDYLEVSVKNDDALVKLAAVVQRLVTATSKDDDSNEFGLSEDERKRLIEEAESEIQKIKQEDDGNQIGSGSSSRDLAPDTV